MKGFESERGRRRGRGAVAALLGGLLVATTGCSVKSNVVTDSSMGFRGDSAEVQMVSTAIGGKNLFIPSTVVVTARSGQKLSIYNTTSVPHGFTIPGLGVETVLDPEKETVVVLPALEGGNVYRIVCHLHPPHRTATLVVLPGS